MCAFVCLCSIVSRFGLWLWHFPGNARLLGANAHLLGFFVAFVVFVFSVLLSFSLYALSE